MSKPLYALNGPNLGLGADGYPATAGAMLRMLVARPAR